MTFPKDGEERNEIPHNQHSSPEPFLWKDDSSCSTHIPSTGHKQGLAWVKGLFGFGSGGFGLVVTHEGTLPALLCIPSPICVLQRVVVLQSNWGWAPRGGHHQGTSCAVHGMETQPGKLEPNPSSSVNFGVKNGPFLWGHYTVRYLFSRQPFNSLFQPCTTTSGPKLRFVPSISSIAEDPSSTSSSLRVNLANLYWQCHSNGEVHSDGGCSSEDGGRGTVQFLLNTSHLMRCQHPRASAEDWANPAFLLGKPHNWEKKEFPANLANWRGAVGLVHTTEDVGPSSSACGLRSNHGMQK